jgi:hypothetical protein
MRRAVTLFTVFAVLCVAGVATAAGPLTGNIEAWKVLVAARTGEESFVPAGDASPRDLIEYRLTYNNSGPSSVRTAKQPDGAIVTFSVDSGKTFHAWPVRVQQLVDGRAVWVDAPASMVTHIRWTLEDELAPTQLVTLAYRAVVR